MTIGGSRRARRSGGKRAGVRAARKNIAQILEFHGRGISPETTAAMTGVDKSTVLEVLDIIAEAGPGEQGGADG